jgi:hypothetical protein
MPDEPEVLALLTLMLLHDARKASRLRDGQVIPFDDQDRTRWDTRQIDEGRALLQRAMTRRRTGPYLLQAAIADLHLYQPRDWRQIAARYQTLARQTGSPIVEMNRAIAVAEIDGPEAGLAILDRLDLDHYRYFHSTRPASCVAPAGTVKPTTRTAARSTSRRPSPNSASFKPGWPRQHPGIELKQQRKAQSRGSALSRDQVALVIEQGPLLDQLGVCGSPAIDRRRPGARRPDPRVRTAAIPNPDRRRASPGAPGTRG